MPTTSPLRDGERTLLPKLGPTTALIRPSEATTGRTMLSKSNPMEDQPTLDAHPLSTQDGGNCSNSKAHKLSTRKERSGMSKEESMVRTRTSKYSTRMERLTSNGMLSILMNTKLNQLRVSSTKDSVFTLRETSTLSQHFHQEDILILSLTKTLLSRLEMEESPNFGTSTKSL